MSDEGNGLRWPADYPGLYQSADKASIRGQTSYLRAFSARLLLAVLAAVSAAFTIRVGDGGTDVAAVVTALAFVAALAVDVGVLRGQPSKAWYEGRALAESVKTLTWRYSVAATPFSRSVSGDNADRLFLERVRLLQRDLPAVAVGPTTAPPITDRMRALRAAPLAERQRAYLHGRVTDQQQWYAAKADYHQRRAGQFRALMLTFEVVGVAGALAKAFGLVDFDLAGIVAASVATLAAWSSAHQHSTTATAYVVTTHELSVIGEVLRQEHDERQWSVTVGDAEEAISREHTLWRASHGE